MNVSKHKATGIIAIGATQGTANLAWTISDASNGLGGVRIGFHAVLAVLATLELLWGLDLYNRITDVQRAREAETSLQLILYKAPVIAGVGAVQLLTNIAWSFSDGTSHLGGVRIVMHVVLASLAVVEINLSIDLWRRLKSFFAHPAPIPIQVNDKP